MVKAVKYESATGNTTQLVVPEKDVVIGRGFLQCDDKRVSRNHGVIRSELAAGEITVYIKALHQTNPIFYRKHDHAANSDSVLRKDESLFLVAGDKFRLTPDGDWFSIVETEETVKTETPDADTQEMEDLGAIGNVAVDRIPQEVSNNEVALKRKHEDESAAEGAKRNRVDDDEAMPSSSSEAAAHASLSTNAEVVEPLLNIKPDPDAHIPNSTSIASCVSTPAQPDEEKVASTSAPPVNVKTDPDGPSAAGVAAGIVVKSPADSGALRPSCDFGIRCYRGGNDHRTSFAHPGDPDYRRPNFPPAPLDAPFCPFGARCYRRNPAHFREYQHPDPNAVVLPRPRRVAVPLDLNNFDAYGEDDEYDQDFDASSSDEYSPGMYDDDADDASESEDEGLGCIDSGFQE